MQKLLKKNSNQILEFTKEAKNLDHEKKVFTNRGILDIIYSDKNARYV